MRKMTLTLLAGLALIGPAGAVMAQRPAAAPAAPAARAPLGPTTRAEALARADATFQQLDLNRDGRVTREEAREARQQRMQTARTERRAAAFDRLDANDDGTISRQEFDSQTAQRGERRGPGRGMRGGRHGGRGGAGMAMRAFGTDGVVTREQFRELAGQRFDRLDGNRDGTVTVEERQAARAALRAQRRGPAPAVTPPAAPQN